MLSHDFKGREEIIQIFRVFASQATQPLDLAGSQPFLLLIFQAVLQHAGSPAAALIVWAGTGIVSFLGALCYAELALLLPESGSDYTYIKRGE